MRTKPCWSDSLGLEILAGWVVAVVVAIGLVLLSECAVQPAHAELYLDAAGGLTQFLITAPDGDYLQRGLPHSLDTRSLAYKVGLGWRFNERWSVQAAYLNLGTVNQSAIFVSDENYDAKAHACLNGCPGQANYRMTDAYKGWELTATRTFKLTEDWAWHVKAGGAYLRHTFSIVRLETGSFHENKGRFYSAVIGGGASYKWAYVEADYYHGLGGANNFMGHDQGWPLSKEMLVTWFGVKIPLS